MRIVKIIPQGVDMIVENDIKKLFNDLKSNEFAHLTLEGFDINVKIFNDKLFLYTPVYFGGNYIPKSVRNCLEQKAPFSYSSPITTYLTIDENQFQISLNYSGEVYQLNSYNFKLLLEEFSLLAKEWHLYLDENDKNDLVHVRVK